MMNFFSKIKKTLRFIPIYWFDFINDIKYTKYSSEVYSRGESLLAFISVDAHTIEKGLTMPLKKYGFGSAKIIKIVNDLKYYTEHFDINDSRFIDIVGIVKEYYHWHISNNIKIENAKVAEALDYIISTYKDIHCTSQIYNVKPSDLFCVDNCSFEQFSLSRHSCRNLSGTVEIDKLKKAIDLTIRTVPSTCNRQSIKLHVISDKKILEIQSGNRGFGYLADKYLLITSDLGYWPGSNQRHAPYVDGGIFIMNLLYSLHFYKIAACTLNMYLGQKNTLRLHKDFNIPTNEVPIALIAIGEPPAQFDLARSTRKTSESVVTYH